MNERKRLPMQPQNARGGPMSHDERTTQLIHRAVEGQATESDLAELDLLLSENAEGFVMRDEIESIARRLNGMPAAARPSVKEAILHEISHEETQKVVAFRPRRRLVAVAAWAVAASLVVGFGVHEWMAQRDQSMQSQASASMTRLGIDDWTVVANVSSANGKLIVRRNGDLFAVEPVLASPVPVSIRWDAGRFDLDEASPSPNASRDGAEVSFGATKKHPTIVLRRRPDAFGTTDIEFAAAGNDTAHATVSLD
jgi:hypothetical protein